MVKAVALFPTINPSTYLYVTNTTITYRGVTRGWKGGAIPREPKSLWGRRMTAGSAENFQQFHKYFLHYSKFASIRPQVQIWGEPYLVLAPGAIYPRYAPGRSKFGGAKWPPTASLSPPCSNLRSFESKCTVLNKVFVTLLGLYGAPCSHSVSQQWFGAP